MSQREFHHLHEQYQRNVDIYISISTFGFIPTVVKWSVVQKIKESLYMIILVLGIILCVRNVVDRSFIKDETYFLFNLIYLFAQYQALSGCILFIILQKTDLRTFREYFDYLISAKDGELPEIRSTIMARTIRFGIIFIRLFVYGAVASTVAIWCFGMVYTNYSSPMFLEIPWVSRESIYFYPVNLILQTAGFFIFDAGIILNDVFVVILVSYFKAEYDCISKLASHLNECSAERSAVILQEIHIAHRDALINMNLLKKHLWHTYLHKLMTASAYLCLIIYVLRFSSAYLAVIGSSIAVSYQVFMVCFIGQLSLNSAENLTKKLYMTKWYDMAPKEKKKLIFMLRISQQNMGIETLGIEAVSNNTFVGIIRGALSYAAFLYTVLN